MFDSRKLCVNWLVEDSLNVTSVNFVYRKNMFRVTTILLMVTSFFNFLYNIFKRYLMKPEFVNDRYLSVGCGKTDFSSSISFIELNYFFQCWRLLVHLYVISELYTCEEQRYLSVRYQNNVFWPKTVYRDDTLQGATKTAWQNDAQSCLQQQDYNPHSNDDKRSYTKNL